MYEIKVKLPVDGFFLEGDLGLPVKAKSIVIFSVANCRINPQCKEIATQLRRAGFGTLLFDLMNKQEIEGNGHKPDIELLTQRLLSYTLWIKSHSDYHNLELGYFGLNTGAAAALRATAELGSAIKALVTKSARTDLVVDMLSKIITPTLLIVGEYDFHSLDINRKALKKLGGDKQLVVIPGASHALEEPGKLTMAAKDAVSWFSKYLASSGMDPEIEYDITESEYD